ncbi:MAG: sensor histidine kinase [Betaproteobacteria bacterium]|nr:sensor histidine kinase [Betaproteobacteria bacterium]
MPNPDAGPLKRSVEPPVTPSAEPSVDPSTPPGARFDDRLLMALGIPAFGIGIPWLTGLYGALTPAQPRWWLGQALFVALAAGIWLGNRWLLFKQREHFDWFSQPLRKLSMLVTAIVLYTAPLTLAVLAAWFALAGQPRDDQALLTVTLTNVICVLFVTHAYETMFLIRERESDLLRVARLERAGAEAQLAALKAQLDPHFLFNSLNTLGHLIVHEPARARAFCDTLAEVYRYVLASRERDTVPLADELQLVRQVASLLALRFGPAMQLELDPALTRAAAAGQWRVPPLGLQTLLENAVKHNQVGSDAPLAVRLALAGDHVRVSNPRRPRTSALPTSGVGLANLDERCRFVTGRALRRAVDAGESDTSGGHFIVEVPLVAESTPVAGLA